MTDVAGCTATAWNVNYDDHDKILLAQDDDDTQYQDGSRIILKVKIRVSSLHLGVYSSTK